MKKIELLAPAGDMEKLEAAIRFSADAVYFAGKKYGLRAFSSNFEQDEMLQGINFAHKHNVKCYITVNILAHNDDFVGLEEYLKYIESCGADGVIVADMGIANVVKSKTKLELHISTQANITNLYSALQWVKLGAKRLVLARELSLDEIKSIKNGLPEDIEIECFCHGAMCVSYSGRCLLSNMLTGRDANCGACAQPCRWSYSLVHNCEDGKLIPIEQDDRGTYILNSLDMCLIEHLDDLINAGIDSIKIEGRMKSPYYVATAVNAYRRALNDLYLGKKSQIDYKQELLSCSNRGFGTGFYFKDNKTENTLSSSATQNCDFIAIVKSQTANNRVLVEMRNSFKVGDELQVLSPDDNFLKKIVVNNIYDQQGEKIEIVNKVQQLVYIETELNLHSNDILRRKINK